ncbi:PQQ-binding-like beta-propeller repeat protein [Kitasatospora purpeofusca]|uniref:outer membrane protein assembly factor BamB family protein n=1 Tax=Kitasatospora purpeofusca TaxID=67352 RepID=UPI0036BC24F2
MHEVLSGVISDATPDMHPTEPAAAPVGAPRPGIHRRRLLLSTVGGLGALAVPAGVRWWADRVPVRGPRIWSTAATGGRMVLPAGQSESLYVSGYDGAVRAHDPRTGSVRWTRAVPAADGSDSPGGWPLAAGNGTVCVNSATGVRALDAASGQVRWEVAVPDWRDLSAEQGIVVAGDRVLTGYGNALRCHDLATGEVRWSTPANVSPVPLVADDTVYVPGLTGGLFAFDALSGERRWAQEAVGPVDFAPTVHRGTLHAVCNDPVTGGSTVHALDAASGRPLWRRAQRHSLGELAVADGTVCLLSGTALTALDSGTGDTRWTATVPMGLGRGMSSAAAAGGAVYVGTNDDRLFAHDLATGRLHWRDEPDRLSADTEYARIALAAVGPAVFRSGRTGIQALGTLPAA